MHNLMYVQKDLTPRVFPFLVSAQSSRHIGDSKSCPPELELSTLTKWLASQCQSVGLGTLLYRAPSSTAMVLHMGLVQQRLSAMASGKWVCQASESASDVPSCEYYTARQTDMTHVIKPACDQTSRRGHHCRKTLPQETFHFQSMHRVPTPQGIQTHVLQTEVSCYNQKASQPMLV